jgi:hypothetical protein
LESAISRAQHVRQFGKESRRNFAQLRSDPMQAMYAMCCIPENERQITHANRISMLRNRGGDFRRVESGFFGHVRSAA